jgi:hypothetical protein
MSTAAVGHSVACCGAVVGLFGVDAAHMAVGSTDSKFQKISPLPDALGGALPAAPSG